jgi:hypothetical protein
MPLLASRGGGSAIGFGHLGSPILVEYLVVAGGGGSQNDVAGGGGAGGFLTGFYPMPTTGQTISVGGGGNAIVSPVP